MFDKVLFDDSLELHNVDFSSFVRIVSQCKGDVFLETEEGDKLNLKSKLSQLLFFSNQVKGGNLGKAKIICTDQEDITTLFRFNLFGEHN